MREAEKFICGKTSQTTSTETQPGLEFDDDGGEAKSKHDTTSCFDHFYFSKRVADLQKNDPALWHFMRLFIGSTEHTWGLAGNARVEAANKTNLWSNAGFDNDRKSNKTSVFNEVDAAYLEQRNLHLFWPLLRILKRDAHPLGDILLERLRAELGLSLDEDLHVGKGERTKRTEDASQLGGPSGEPRAKMLPPAKDILLRADLNAHFWSEVTVSTQSGELLPAAFSVLIPESELLVCFDYHGALRGVFQHRATSTGRQTSTEGSKQYEPKICTNCPPELEPGYKIGQYVYQALSAANMTQFVEEFGTTDAFDFSKPGLKKHQANYTEYLPRVREVIVSIDRGGRGSTSKEAEDESGEEENYGTSTTRKKNSITLVLDWAVDCKLTMSRHCLRSDAPLPFEEYGAPQQVVTRFAISIPERFDKKADTAAEKAHIKQDTAAEIKLDVLLQDKRPTRLPEVSWILFSAGVPTVQQHGASTSRCRGRKLGRYVDLCEGGADDSTIPGSFALASPHQHGVYSERPEKHPAIVCERTTVEQAASSDTTSAKVNSYHALGVSPLHTTLVVLWDKKKETALLPPAFPTPYNPPECSPRFGFVIHDNLWNTNYPAWYPIGGPFRADEKRDQNLRASWQISTQIIHEAVGEDAAVPAERKLLPDGNMADTTAVFV
ncbi:unnamed protein product [Amoebophrya sp. A120]|nr:unnamed protein product [Amoebophrya sp. A120]|eukprot:GSA120T00012727001.1